MASTSKTHKEKTWVGTSMEDIYNGHGPWGFEIPAISPSRVHAILYKLPTTLKNPPKPQVSAKVLHWDNDHVCMPFSEKNVFSIKNEKGEKVIIKQRWKLIQKSLSQPIKSSKELEAAINSYNPGLPKFSALHNFFETLLEKKETQLFFDIVLPDLIRLALQLPDILPGSIPLLKQGARMSISFSQLQIASLLANGFLCTFPYSKDSSSLYSDVNFARLFNAHTTSKQKQKVVAEKLKCICHYFRRVLAKAPVGVVTFEREHLLNSQVAPWDLMGIKIGRTRIHISSTGGIEDGDGLLQVVFSNKNVGGGVLSFGCGQEEIRFITCPELIVSRLFTEQLGPTDALVITGTECYNKYTGYGDSFAWADDCRDQTPHDSSGRRRTSIVAIDALPFTKPEEECSSSNMLRELNKAYVGFYSGYDGPLPAVATGNWGSGAFGGNPYLKAFLQLMACGAARRDMVYFTLGDTTVRDQIYGFYQFIRKFTIAQVWLAWSGANSKAKASAQDLLCYIREAHFDRSTSDSDHSNSDSDS